MGCGFGGILRGERIRRREIPRPQPMIFPQIWYAAVTKEKAHGCRWTFVWIREAYFTATAVTQVCINISRSFRMNGLMPVMSNPRSSRVSSS